jgi:ABC-type transporter Mla subunit MlaD
MAERTRSAANILAGGFLIAGLIGFVVISSVISGTLDRLHPTEAYTIRFDMERGAPGVKAGSTVTMGGQPVGRVAGVAFAQEDGRATGVDVTVRVRTAHRLYRDAKVVLVRPLLGEGGTLNVVSAGTAAAGLLDPGATIPASIAVPSFLADAGYGQTQVAQVQQMIDTGSAMVERADALVARLDQEMLAITADARVFSALLRETSGLLRDRLPELQDGAGDLIARLDTTGEGIDRVVALAERILDETRMLVETNGPRISDALGSIQRVSARVEAEHAERALELITEATDAARDLGDAAARTELLLAEQGPSIERSLANARLASDQLRQASVEIRRNPWRLLARPDTKELEAEIVYDAVRSHTDAASDLRDAAAALSGVLGTGLVDPEHAEALRLEITGAMERYTEAQTRLLELIE